MSDEHTCFIGSDFLSDEWETSCSCGWTGSPHDSEGAAFDEWENHTDVVFMEATMEGPTP